MIANVPLSFLPLILLAGIFLASLSVFLVLSHRWTSHRLALELGDWAKEHRFTFRSRAKATLPAPLSKQHQIVGRAQWLISDNSTSLVRFITDPQNENEASAAWNVLVRRTITNWPATGLRPSHHPASVIDFFALSLSPQSASTERFTVFGNDPTAARKLSRSSARALLPPDIGLLRVGEYLLLDFSSRHFDPIEFGRMLALVDQVEKAT